MNNYYVYGHYISGSHDPFYIGKGKEQRAWVTQHRNFLWKEVVAEHGYEVRIIQDNTNEADALLLETELIEKYGKHSSFFTSISFGFLSFIAMLPVCKTNCILTLLSSWACTHATMKLTD